MPPGSQTQRPAPQAPAGRQPHPPSPPYLLLVKPPVMSPSHPYRLPYPVHVIHVPPVPPLVRPLATCARALPKKAGGPASPGRHACGRRREGAAGPRFPSQMPASVQVPAAGRCACCIYLCCCIYRLLLHRSLLLHLSAAAPVASISAVASIGCCACCIYLCCCIYRPLRLLHLSLLLHLSAAAPVASISP